MKPLPLITALALLVAPARAGDVIHVPADVPYIEDAVALAAPGDVVLVDATTYVPPDDWPPFIETLGVAGKGISLIAEGVPVTLLLGEISAVPAGETFVLRGFELGGGWPQGSGYSGLVIQGCTGRVRVEECTLRGFTGGYELPPVKPGGVGLVVEDSASVVLRRCEILGAHGGATLQLPGGPPPQPYSGGHGLVVHSSRVAVYDSHLTGGYGGSSTTTAGTAPAGDGVRVDGDTRLHLSGSTVGGGGGAFGPVGGAGGHGLYQLSIEASTSARDTPFAGGAGGGSAPGSPPGPDGQALAIEAGGFTEYPAPHRQFAALSPGYEGQALTLEFVLQPDDQALLAAALDGAHVELPMLQGVLHLDPPAVRALPPRPAGRSELDVRLPLLPPTVQALDVTLQLVVQSADGELLLGPASGVALLSPDAPILDVDCPLSVVVSCDESTAPEHTGMATGSSTCGAVAITWSDVTTPTGCSTALIERTWTATDTCGVSTSCVQTISVVDTPPEVVAPPDVWLTYTEPTTPEDTGFAVAVDGCGPATVTFSDETTPGDCVLDFTITRTWTATDSCGLTASADQLLHVRDEVAPALVVPPDAVLPCGAPTAPDDTGTASGSDDAGEVLITYTDSFHEDCALSGTGRITRTWTATDPCGNTTSLDQLITIEPEPFSMSCPPDVTLPCGEPKPPHANGLGQFLAQGGSVDPPCGLPLSAVTVFWLGDTPSGSGCSKVITRKYRAVDGCGNTTQCAQLIRWAEAP